MTDLRSFFVLVLIFFFFDCQFLTSVLASDWQVFICSSELRERVSLYFGGGGLILNTFKLSLINLYRVKYLKEAFYFWFQELCSSVT